MIGWTGQREGREKQTNLTPAECSGLRGAGQDVYSELNNTVNVGEEVTRLSMIHCASTVHILMQLLV